MASTTTIKPINLGQLSAEMGGVPMTANLHEGVTTINTVDDSVDLAVLEAAISAHVAIDEQANKLTIEDRARLALTANNNYLSITTPTAAQISAQVKALTRQNNALIRLLLNKFDSID